MKKTATIFGAGALAIALMVTAFAHSGATGIVKKRMDGMMAMGKAMGTVADMFKGKTPFDRAKVVTSAAIVKNHAAEMARLFPNTKASRNGKGTEALPAIWERNEDFVALTKALKARAIQLAKTSENGDLQAVRGSFARLAGTCSSCHKDYRKPEN